MTRNDSAMPRRDFVRAFSLGTTAFASGGILEACATAPVATTPSPATRSPTEWDMSWLERLTAPHRVVFDVTATANGMALWQSAAWMEGFALAHGVKDTDLNAVLVFRHDAVTMVLDDPMWTRLGLTAPANGDARPLAEGKRNPYLGTVSPSPKPDPSKGMATVGGLLSRGVIMLACNNALGGQSYKLKQKEGLSETDAHAQVRAAVAPGVYVMPNGIFSVGRAQDAGCGYFKPG
jgi:hypothetical protein